MTLRIHKTKWNLSYWILFKPEQNYLSGVSDTLNMGLNSNDKHNAEDAIKHQTVARQEAFYNQPQMLLHLKVNNFI